VLSREEVVKQANKLPPLPTSCIRLAAIVAQEEPNFKEIEKIVSYDPVLTAQVLRVANSAMFGGVRTIGSVRDAVVRVGVSALFGVTVASATAPLMDNDLPAYGLTAADLWAHSMTAAVASRAVVEMRPRFQTPYTFTAALLHDIGKLILGPMMTPQMAEFCRRAVDEGAREQFEAELEVLTVHHAEVGAIVAEHWRLPEPIVNALRNHHTPLADDDPTAAVVAASDVIAKLLDERYSPPTSLDSVCDRLGISSGEFQRLCGLIAQRAQGVTALYA